MRKNRRTPPTPALTVEQLTKIACVHPDCLWPKCVDADMRCFKMECVVREASATRILKSLTGAGADQTQSRPSEDGASQSHASNRHAPPVWADTAQVDDGAKTGVGEGAASCELKAPTAHVAPKPAETPAAPSDAVRWAQWVLSIIDFDAFGKTLAREVLAQASRITEMERIVLSAQTNMDRLLKEREALSAELARWKLQSDDWQKRGWELGVELDEEKVRAGTLSAEVERLKQIAGERTP